MLPRESDYPRYKERDSYVKYFLFGDSKDTIPDHLRARTDLDEEQIISIWRAHPHLAERAHLALAAWKRDPLDLSALAAALDGVAEAHGARNR